MKTIIFGSGLALILIFSMALTIAVIGIVFWAAFKSPRTGRRNGRYPHTDASGAFIPAAGLIDNNNPAPGPGHFDAGSHGGHSHGHHDSGGGHSHSHGGSDGGGGNGSGGDSGGGCSGGGDGGGGGGGDGGGGS